MTGERIIQSGGSGAGEEGEMIIVVLALHEAEFKQMGGGSRLPNPAEAAEPGLGMQAVPGLGVGTVSQQRLTDEDAHIDTARAGAGVNAAAAGGIIKIEPARRIAMHFDDPGLAKPVAIVDPGDGDVGIVGVGCDDDIDAPLAEAMRSTMTMASSRSLNAPKVVPLSLPP